MTAPIYGDWIAHNATPDSTCPPDAVGKRGQWQGEDERRCDMIDMLPRSFDELWHWNYVIAYRVLIEPVRGVETLWREDDGWADCDYGKSTHTLRLPTLDGALIPGEYTGPGGVITVTEVR